MFNSSDSDYPESVVLESSAKPNQSRSLEFCCTKSVTDYREMNKGSSFGFYSLQQFFNDMNGKIDVFK